MKQSFLFANLIFILYLFTSCGSSKTIAGDATSYVTPIICAEEYSQKYNMQLDFMKHHLSGMLIVRRMPENEIRILASTYFGLSLFDFSLRGENFLVNSCVAPMQKEKVLKLLEMDFKHLFLSSKGIRVRTSKDGAIEKRTSGKGFGKSIVSITGETQGDPEQVRIRHPWIRLTIQLDKLPKDN